MSRRNIIVAAVLLTVIVGAVFAGLRLVGDDDHGIAENPWKPASAPYGSDCDAACQKNVKPLAPISNTHLKGVVLFTRPDVDDAYAQLGDCLDQVMACMNKAGNALSAPSCVAASSCPAPCKAAFGGLSDNIKDGEKLLDLIETVFITGEQYCSPRRWEAGK